MPTTLKNFGSTIPIGIPFDGMGRAGGQALAAQTLREAGLLEALGLKDSRVDEPRFPPPRAERGIHGLLNENALLAMVEHVYQEVRSALKAGGIPMLYGGDCASLLGAVPAAVSVMGRAGLAFVDAHEDSTTARLSPDGEAANMELGILLGLGDLPRPEAISRAHGVLEGEATAMFGLRDDPYRHSVGIPTVEDRVGAYVSHHSLENRDEGTVDAAATILDTQPWWLHVDLDVLCSVEFPCYGAPGEMSLPGGLSWDDLHWLTERTVSRGGCVGASVVIYNPEKDPKREGARSVVKFLGHLSCLLERNRF